MALITELIGSFKKYQLYVYLLVFGCKCGIAFHQFAIIIVAPVQTFTCPNNATCCDRPVYDTSLFTRTIIMEWHLICERSWLPNLSQTLYQVGVMLGSLFFGMASDRFGRRPALIGAVVMEIVSGVLVAFMPDFWSFVAVRMIVGCAVGGIMVVGFVILMEFIGADKRFIFSCLVQTPFTLGHMATGVLAYFIRNYITFLIVIALLNAPLLIYICVLPESPRWLLAVNKTEEAVILLKKIAKFNKMPTDKVETTVEQYQRELSSGHNRKSTTADLFRTPNIRKNTIVMSVIWFACSYAFYGMAQYVGQLTGNMFVNVIASAAVCTIATFVSIPLMKHMKRKPSVILSNTGCGLCIILTIVVPDGACTVTLACIGVLFSFIIFCIIYLYCTEMFPTIVRNSALGISSMTARIGSMIAPFVVSLQSYGSWCTPLAFGILPLIAAGMCLLLPETKDIKLLNTIEEGEALGKKLRGVSSTTEPVRVTETNSTGPPPSTKK